MARLTLSTLHRFLPSAAESSRGRFALGGSGVYNPDVTSHFVVARTRVRRPPLPPDHLDRPLLRARLDTLADGGIGAVIAGAGYGKSSLLAAWAAARPRVTAWYAVAEGDDDAEVFATHVAAAVEGALSVSVLAGLDPERWRTVLDAAINVMCEHPGLALVLDDAHHLHRADAPSSDRTCEALTYLLRYVPDTTAVVLAARRLPPIREWNAWAARGRVRVSLSPADLALGRDEVEALLTLRRATDAEAGAVDALTARVGGWPLALDLLARSPSLATPLAGGGPGVAPLEDEAAALLDDYIAHELFEDMAPRERAFLEDCSVLDAWTTDLCAAVSGQADAGRLLSRLSTLGVVSPSGDAWRVHQVFLDFLGRLRHLDPEGERARQGRAAEALASRGMRVEALPHLVAAGEVEAAEDILASVALPRARLLGLTERLGEAALDARPRLRVVRGRALRRGNAYERALAELDRAAARAAALGLAGVQSEALAEAAAVYVDTVQPSRAHALLRQAYRLVPATNVDARGHILDLIAENCVNQGRASAALRYRRRSRALLAGPRDGALDARILLRTGQLAAARATVEARLATQAASQGAAPSPRPDGSSAEAHREEVLVLAYIAALEGDTTAAERAARQGQALGAATGSPFTEAVAFMRLGHALQQRPGVPFEEVVGCYARAQALGEQTGVERVRAEALMGLALAYAARGDVPRSYAHATDGLTVTVRAGDTWLSAWLRLATGIAGLGGRHPDAAAVLRAARADMVACREAFGTAVADLWLAIASGEGLARVADDLRARGYAFLLERPTLFGPRTPVEVSPPAAVAYRLRVQCLGPFRAWRGADEVSARAWKREKARELFLVLLTRRGHLQQKEALMDLLWPEATPQAANRDFRVALHALSEALDPERPKNALARCIERRGTAYALCRDPEIEIDVDEMERLIGLGNQESRPDLWQRALNLYQADFLEDLPYAEWAEAERDRLRALYVDTAERLARHAFIQGDDETALHLAHTILARDRCWEEAWRIVMRVHQRQGRAFLAVRAYEDCVAALEDELGVEPSDETRALIDGE